MSNWSYTRVGAKDGKGIQSITEYYKLSANTTETFSASTISTWSTSVSQPTSAKPYLLNAELVVYSDGTKEYKAPHVASRYVTDGQAGRGIAGITEYYLATSASSGVTRSTSGWTTAIQTMTSTKKYLWNYEETTYTDDSDPSYTNPCIIGVYGDKGDKGDQGERGLQGIQGPQGEQGIPGTNGTNGKTSYFHIKYSSKANPTTAADMTETPSEYIGTYVDYTSSDSTDPSKYTWSRFKGLQGEQGEQGIPGTNGADGQTYYLHIAYATNSTGTSGFSTTSSANKTYIGQYTDTNATDSTDPTEYKWTKIKGDAGASSYSYVRYSANADGTDFTATPSSSTKYVGFYSGSSSTAPTDKASYTWTKFVGADGNDGRGISSTEIKYATSTSNTTAPSSGWQSTVPSVAQGSYLWTRTTIKYTSGSDSVSYTVARQGSNGTNGSNGTSVTISSKSVKYQAGTSGTTAPSGTWSDTVPSVTKGQYLWTKTEVTYSDGNSTTSYSVGYAGTNGTNGTSPYACSVSNENFTVATGTDLKPLSATTYSVKFTAYKGSTQLSAIAPSATIASGKFKVSTPTATGFTVAQSTNGTLTFTTATGTAISANLSVNVTVTYDNGSTETKTITISASKTGATGDSGTTWYRGNKINGYDTNGRVYSGSGISNARIGDFYFNTDTQDIYECVLGGNASTALWKWNGNLTSDENTNLIRFNPFTPITSVANKVYSVIEEADAPWGGTTDVMKCFRTGEVTTQWNTINKSWSKTPIDTSKKYRFSLFFKQITTASNISNYFGAGIQNDANYVASLGSDTGHTNFYFTSFSTYREKERWYLLVAHIHPFDTTRTTADDDSGIYDALTGEKLSNVNDCKWMENAPSVYIRNLYVDKITASSYPDSAVEQWFCSPRIDICNGLQPSVKDLLNGNFHTTEWYSGTAITGTSTTGTVFSGSGISWAVKGDKYLNTDTNNLYECTYSGSATVAKWAYQMNIKGDKGDNGTLSFVSDQTCSWTDSQWNDYSTAGRVTSWNNSTVEGMRVGDILQIPVTLTGQGNITGVVYARITSIPTTKSGGLYQIPTVTLYGQKGNKGDNAITYEIECPSTFKKGNTVTFNFYKWESGVRTAASVYYQILISSDGSTYTSHKTGTGFSETTNALNTTTHVKCIIKSTSSSTTDLDTEYSIRLGENYTCGVSNQNFSVATDNSLKPLSATTYQVQFKAYRGDTALTAVTGTPTNEQFKVVAPSAPTGFKTPTVSVSGGTATLTFEPTGITTVIGANATVDVTVQYEGTTVTETKLITISASKQGNKGDQGFNYIGAIIRDNHNEAWWTDPVWSSVDGSTTWTNQNMDKDGTVTKLGTALPSSKKVGDYFDVTGTASDTGNVFTCSVRITAISGNSITATTINLSKIQKGAKGDRGFSSRTIAFRANYSAFSSPNVGEVYVCGYDSNGAEADTAGYVIVNGVTYYSKGKLDSNAAMDGYIIIPKTSTSSSSPSRPEYAYYSGSGWYKIANDLTSGNVAATSITAADYIALAKIHAYSAEGIVTVTPITPCLLSSITQPIDFYYEGIVATVTQYTNASITPYKVTRSGDGYTKAAITARNARRGAVVFDTRAVTPTASTAAPRIMYYNGTYWNEISSSNALYSKAVAIMAGDLLGIAGYYRTRELPIPSICGTYMETLYCNIALIERLFSQQATIDELQSLSLLFSEYCGSINSKNPSIGDMMIYMGKNPRLTAATREFQFAISQYLGKVGQQEMWSDKLITKFLASGLLALNLIGCVQTTDGVYSRQGEDWNESVNFFDNNAYRITSLMAGKVGGYYAFIDTWGEIFLTEDFKTSTKSLALKNSLSRVDSVLATAIWKQGTLKAIVVTSEENYYTEDYLTWNSISGITPVENVDYYTNAKCGNWRTPGAFFIKKNSDFWITKNFDTTWTHLTLPFDGNVYVTDNNIIIGSASSDNLILIDSSFNLSSVPNILKTASYGNNHYMNVYDNRLFGFGTNGICFADENFESLQENAFITPIPQMWASMEFYNGRIFFFSSDGELKYIDVQNPSEFKSCNLTIPFGQGANSLNVVESAGVISAYNYSQPNSLFISFDGGNSFKKVEKLDSNYNFGTVFSIETLNLYGTLGYQYDSDSGFYFYKLYTSRGREAGSGIISESLDKKSSSENGFVQFSNDFALKWGDANPSAQTVVDITRSRIRTSAPSSPEFGDIWIE